MTVRRVGRVGKAWKVRTVRTVGTVGTVGTVRTVRNVRTQNHQQQSPATLSLHAQPMHQARHTRVPSTGTIRTVLESHPYNPAT